MTQIDQTADGAVEERADAADNRTVGRAAFFIAIIGALVGLCLMAWRLAAVVDTREAAAGTAGPATTPDLVAGDPVTDIHCLQDRNALRVIMKDGQVHKAPAAA